MSLKAKIEAVLFLSSKPIKAQAIARIVNADVQSVRQAILELVHDYEERQGGLEIADDDGYSFQVREEFASLMDEFLPIEMSAALIRTLSAIAIKQPVMQSEIIRVRGAGAYDHIKELVAKELVAKKEEQGERSPMLSTTKKFQEYFKLSKDGKDLRNYLKKQVKKMDAAAAAAGGEQQLVIPAVVSSDTDAQINSGIYLETADTPDDVTTDVAAEVAAEAAEMAAEVAASISESADLSFAAETVLNKLADAAAEANEPELPSIDDVEVTPSTSTTSVQANNQKRKEPKTAKTPPSAKKQPASKKQPPSLFDLLVKQKELEKQLKIGDIEIADEPIVTPLQIQSDVNQIIE